MISTAALQQFKDIWRDEVGTELSEGELIEQATALLTMFDAIFKPIKRDEYEQ